MNSTLPTLISHAAEATSAKRAADGLYTSEFQSALRDMIKESKKNFPTIFGKKKND